MRALPLSFLALLLLPNAPAAATEIKVGFLFSQTSASYHQEAFSMFKLAIRDMNANPYVLPYHTLTYTYEDTGGTPMGALESTERLLNRSVVAVIGADLAGSVMGVSSYCSFMRTPVLNPASRSTDHIKKQTYPYLFRTAPGDGPELKAIPLLVYALGWTDMAVLVNDEVGGNFADEMEPVISKLGLRYTSQTYAPLGSGIPASRVKMNKVLTQLVKGGHRVIALVAQPTDSVVLHASAQMFGLLGTEYVWLMQDAIYSGAWTNVPNVLMTTPFGGGANSQRDGFRYRWPIVSTRYDPAVHGYFDLVTKLPFYDNSSRIWDTSDTSLGGDGVPDTWASLVYDSTTILALALNLMVNYGFQPSNGDMLRQALLMSSVQGISGSIAFDSDQERKSFVPLVLARGVGVPPYLVATTTDQLFYPLATTPDWCKGAGCQSVNDTFLQCGSPCLDTNRSMLSAIPWPGGQQPHDGGMLDLSSTKVTVHGQYYEKSKAEVSVAAKNFFGEPPCKEDCLWAPQGPGCARCLKMKSSFEELILEAYEESGRQVEGFTPYYVWQAAVDFILVGTRNGFAGSEIGFGQRRLNLTVRYLGNTLGSKFANFRRSHCNVGQFVSGTGDCDFCLPGSVAPELGRTSCTACAVGTVQPYVGGGTCNGCEAGKMMASEGQTECELCGLGRFTAQTGSSVCVACPAPMTTLAYGGKNITDCVCPSGMYRPAAVTLTMGMTSSPCTDCPKGMECKDAADERRLLPGAAALGPEAVAPIVLPEFWSEYAAPMSVFRCSGGPRQCPGGAPETCGPQWGDTACAVCDFGYYRDGGVCTQCPSSAVSQFLFPIIPILAGLIIVVPYYKLHLDKGIRSWNEDAKAGGHVFALLLAFVQLGGLLLACNLNMPKAGSTSEVWSQLNTPMGLFQMDCVGIRTFQSKLAVGLIMPLWGCGIFVVFLVCSKVLNKLFGLPLMSQDTIGSCVGSLFLAFYITICAMSLDLFKCYPHPNGEKSVISAPQVLCGSGEWTGMVAVAAVGAVIYCGLSMVVFIYALYIAPRYRKSEAFHKRWKFLLARFRPLERWWGIVWLLKGLALNCVQVALVDGQNQLVAFQCILSVYGVLALWRQPWRHYSVNAVDAVVHLIQAFACSLLFWYAPVTDNVDRGRAMMVEKIMMPVPLCILLLLVVAKRLWEQRKVRNGKRATVSSKFVDRNRRILATFVDYDLQEAADLFSLVAPLDRNLFISFCVALKMEPLFAEHADQLEFIERLTTNAGREKSIRPTRTGKSVNGDTSMGAVKSLNSPRDAGDTKECGQQVGLYTFQV